MANQEFKCCYDVFLSFRGEDTRHSFTGNLYDALRRKGVNTFMDDEELHTGDQISTSLLKAIEDSRISIVVLSQNYASSRCCLDELVKILDCMKTKNQLVWPVFYEVDPSDVRHQKSSYGEAMTKHEIRYGNHSQMVQTWRSALFQVANLKGEHFKGAEYEYEFIQRIVEMAIAKSHCGQLDVGEHIIGHQSRIEELMPLLDIEYRNTVCMVGIHGVGGIGKTTLAKALYNLIVDRFECAIFLEGVRETSSNKGLKHLQEAFLSKLLEGKIIKLGSVDEGAARLKDRLCHKRILLVLDDVDSEDQLEKLAGKCNWFGSDSRIIITTRDKHVLNVHEVKNRYEMKELNDHEAFQLFCWKAFKMSQPATNYEDVSNLAVQYAKGLPLALEVIGSNLAGKSIMECESALKQYERIPERNIQDILKVSYDCLPENAQSMFLDIACFFKGEKREYVEDILERCNFYPAFNIGILVDRSLLTIDEYSRLRMHDLIQDMGKEVVRQEAPRKPGERSRLCFHEDIIIVLTKDSGSSNIEGIILDPPEDEEVEWNGTAFEKMKNLRILIVRNASFSAPPNYLPNSLRLLEWKGYPSESLPPGFCPRNVVVLSLPNSHLRLQKEKPFLILVHLTDINFSECQSITHIPDVSGVPNLRNLCVSNCTNLVAVDHSVGFLKHLECLSAKNCTSLVIFPRKIWLPSLRELYLNNTLIEFFPDVEGVMDKLFRINLSLTPITGLPLSITNLMGLEWIAMWYCNSIRDLPINLFILPGLKELYAAYSQGVRESFRRFRNSCVLATIGCSNLNKPHNSSLTDLHLLYVGLTDEDLHFILGCFPNLERLRVKGNNFVSLPASIKDSAKLKVLDVSHCVTLEEIPKLPFSIEQVSAAHCPSLTSETSRKLWSLVFDEVYQLELVIMPWFRTEIPDWLDHHCEGGIVSLSARRKFPVLAFAFIFEDTPPTTSAGFWYYRVSDRKMSTRYSIYDYYANAKDYIEKKGYKVDANMIAGDHVLLFGGRHPFGLKDRDEELPEWTLVKVRLNFRAIDKHPYPLKVMKVDHFRDNVDYWCEVEGDHVALCDVGSQVNADEWPILDTLLVSEWNFVEFKCEIPKHWTVSYCGAYMYKYETNREDIQTCFNPLKRTPSISHDAPKKRVKKLKPKRVGKGSRKAIRRSTQFQTISSRSRRSMKKMAFPVSKCFWRFLSYGFSMSKNN